MIRKSPEAYAPAATIALLTALHKILYASVLVNDDFMHRAYAGQLLAGELPIRDFFDYGMVLMYVASAVSQMLFGYRLLAEAVVIGAMVGISSFVVAICLEAVTVACGRTWCVGCSRVLLASGPWRVRGCRCRARDDCVAWGEPENAG